MTLIHGPECVTVAFLYLFCPRAISPMHMWSLDSNVCPRGVQSLLTARIASTPAGYILKRVVESSALLDVGVSITEINFLGRIHHDQNLQLGRYTYFSPITKYS